MYNSPAGVGGHWSMQRERAKQSIVIGIIIIMPTARRIVGFFLKELLGGNIDKTH
jgi:hypothetical protein